MPFNIPRGGDTPHIIRGVQEDYRRLYYSDHRAALRIPITVQAGYGVVRLGTAVARNISASSLRAGRFVPYNPTAFVAASVHVGRTALIADGAALANTVRVTIADSYKFAVGDDIIINDNVTAAENLGAITVIDRLTNPNFATITFTTAIGATAFTVARLAYISVEAGAANNFSDCVGILERSIDTGLGQYAEGGHGTLILGNCVVYDGALWYMDGTARTAIGATLISQYMYIN